MRISLVTPAPAGSLLGNRRTALRWARFLRDDGHRVRIETEWSGAPCDVLIALHARRSRPSILAFRAARPQAPLVLMLTGTDLYRDIHVDAAAADSLALAQRLVVLQERGVNEVPARFHPICRVITQSVELVPGWSPPNRFKRALVLGHLREEKDPLCAARALARLTHRAEARVVLAGAPLTPDWETLALAMANTEPRFRWLGEISHGRAMRLLRASHVLVVSSRMEGGAHVIAEAAAVGTPVLASAISGNLGMLGADYPGYYPFGDDATLAQLLDRAFTEPQWLRTLADATVARRHLFAPERERLAIRSLIHELA